MVISRYFKSNLKLNFLKIKESGSTGGGLLNGIATGIPDGITVLLVVITGLSKASAGNALLLKVGWLALATGALTMGISAYFTNRSERKHFTDDLRNKELKEKQFLANLGIGEDIQQMAQEEIRKDNEKWSHLMHTPPLPYSAFKNGLTIAAGYIIGGIIPLLPFMGNDRTDALSCSWFIALISLLVFGYIKGKQTGGNPWLTALRVTLIALLATACIYAAVAVVN